MIRLLTILFCFFVGIYECSSQEIPLSVEQQLEDLTDEEEGETEDDSFIQQLEQYKLHPLNINTASSSELRELRMLSDLQIDHFIQYRNLLGPFLTIYELQAVPFWDIGVIKKLLPYLTFNTQSVSLGNFKRRFWGGEHSFTIRGQQVLEKARGFIVDSSGSKYLGSLKEFFLDIGMCIKIYFSLE